MTKRKRGVATFSMKDCDYTLEFDEDRQPIGKNANNFASWLGVKMKAEFSYHIPQKFFEKHRWEDLWADIKREWHFEGNEPKDVVLKNARKRHTNWRSTLTKNYVRKNLRPFKKYKNLDDTHWDDFVKERSTEDFMKKSEKATNSAKSNKRPTRLGRIGFAALNPKLAGRWAQIVAKYKNLKIIGHLRSQRYLVSRAKKIRNKKTKEVQYELPKDAHAESIQLAELEETMKKDGTYGSGVDDPLTRLLGPEHGGRTRTTSNIIGRTKVRGGLFKIGRQESQIRSEKGLGSAPDISGVGDVLGGSCMQYPSIEEPTLCQLLYPGPSKKEKVVGAAYVQPTTSRIIHGSQMEEGYVKIQVYEIDPDYKKTPLPPPSCIDELEELGDTPGYFIQWPLYAIKLSKTVATGNIPPSTQLIDDETCYEPEFEDPAEQNPIQYQINPAMIDNFEDEFLLGEHVSPQPVADVLEGLDSMFSNQDVPVERPASSKISKLEQDIKNALWNIENVRPQKIKSLAERLTKHYNGGMSIEINLPDGMYPITEFDLPVEYIEYEGMLQFLANGLLDASILHWCQMHLYNLPKKRTSQVSYFNPQKITGEECRFNFASVRDHLLHVYSFHKGSKYFLAPFLNGRHWVLFIVSPKEKRGWILDSVLKKGKKNKTHYPLTKAIETSFGGRFDWNMVECKQQDGSWECGYLVIKNMFEFVISKQFAFPNNIWNDTTDITEVEIDKLVANIMYRFFGFGVQ